MSNSEEVQAYLQIYEAGLKKHIEIFNKCMEATNKHFEVTDICIQRLKTENIMLLILMAMICIGLFISR